ncbi:MAG: DUF4453 domain-containing protein [Marinosulfonomonas sp.]|nr:DUF4453 domain-containing protein [Marinosulfonomonas sp.]
MRFVWSFLALFTIASPVVAGDVCDNLWFTRNLLFDRAGYCFGSILGKAVFDNADCTTKEPGLDAQERDVLDAVKAREAELECKVDSRRTTLDVDMIMLRMAMLDLPLATGFESACFGWNGIEMPLHNARHSDSHVLGYLQVGDNIGYFYDPLTDDMGRDWNFITQYRNGQVVGVGWALIGDDLGKCDAYAG